MAALNAIGQAGRVSGHGVSCHVQMVAFEPSSVIYFYNTEHFGSRAVFVDK